MKFDKIIMNPPYSGSLHLKILSGAMEHSDEVVNLSPANQMFAGLRLIKEHSEIKKNPKLVEHIQDVNLILPEVASKLFRASFAGPLMIIYYNMTKNGKDYKDFNIIKPELRSIFMKTVGAVHEGKYPNLMDEIKRLKGHKGKFSLTCPEVHGNQGKPNWAEIASSNYEKALQSEQRFGWHLEFDNEEERRNCWECWHLKSHKFIHSLIKSDNFNAYGELPLLDYTHKWTDEQLYDYFDLTQEERKIIEKETKWY